MFVADAPETGTIGPAVATPCAAPEGEAVATAVSATVELDERSVLDDDREHATTMVATASWSMMRVIGCKDNRRATGTAIAL